MKLKEIEFDLPYKKNGKFINSMQKEKAISYEAAVKMDYELNWKEKRHEFRLMTRCMTSMLERIMQPVKTKDFWKIIIECVDTDECKEPKNLLGVLVIQTYFDITLFYSLNENEQKKMIIDEVFHCFQKNIVDEFSDKMQIIKACHEIMDKNYINEWVWKTTTVRQGR